MKNVYISTSIPYINGVPHVGHALESIIADAIARYKRMKGASLFFLTGTDEHGTKIVKTAEKEGLDVLEFCNKNSDSFKSLMSILEISNDCFIRTSDQRKHWPVAQRIWNQLKEKGDIYKKEYKGKYCVGCEAFLSEKDLIDGVCPNHKKAPEEICEENYFFRLSKYSDRILEIIESKQMKIIPEYRKNEIVNMLKNGGLKDVSFSRPKSSLTWGVPVPDDENQVMYVWCDALTNYISALNYGNDDCGLFNKFWIDSDRIHVIGKDIVRFHAGIWIGMLLSIEVPIPSSMIIHGFLTSEGEKMSKSIGNVVDPFMEVEKYGVDALRYFLLSQVIVGQDYDYTRLQFENIYNAHLANNLGNVINRIWVLCDKYNVTPLDIEFSKSNNEYEKLLKETWELYEKNMDNFELHGAVEVVFKLLDYTNKRINELEPWVVAKVNPQELKNILPPFLEVFRQVSYMLEPIIPHSSIKIQEMIGVSTEKISFEGMKTWNYLQSNWKKLGQKEILFPKIVSEKS